MGPSTKLSVSIHSCRTPPNASRNAICTKAAKLAWFATVVRVRSAMRGTLHVQLVVPLHLARGLAGSNAECVSHGPKFDSRRRFPAPASASTMRQKSAGVRRPHRRSQVRLLPMAGRTFGTSPGVLNAVGLVHQQRSHSHATPCARHSAWLRRHQSALSAHFIARSAPRIRQTCSSRKGAVIRMCTASLPQCAVSLITAPNAPLRAWPAHTDSTACTHARGPGANQPGCRNSTAASHSPWPSLRR